MRTICSLILIALFSGSFLRAGEGPAAAALRRPVGLAVSPNGERLFVANRKTGTISIVDPEAKKVIAEPNIGVQLSSIERDPSGKLLLVTDDAAHELIIVKINDDELTVTQRLPVPKYPLKVVVSPDSKTAYVASLWSRQLARIQLTPDELGQATVAEVLSLDFAPREMLLLPEQKRLLVADNFGGKLAVCEIAPLKLALAHEIPAHNIRGLRLSAKGDKLLVAHQMLNEKAHSIQSDVHWGLLISNDLHWIRLDSVLNAADPKDNPLYRGGHMHPLGEPGRGGGDPTSLDVAADGRVIVTLGGTDDISVGKEDDFSFRRIRFAGTGSYEYGDQEYENPQAATNVLRRPIAVKFSPDGKRAFTADMFGDTVSLVDLDEQEITGKIPLGTRPKDVSLVDRGEEFFFDARLSHDGWMSCQSCHTDGHTNSQMNDNLSDGGFGSSKRVLSLLGQRDTAPYAWSGKVLDLKSQVRNSLEKTMLNRTTPTEEQIDAIVAYVAQLPLPPPVAELREERLDAASVARGKMLFAKRECSRCHAGSQFTSAEAFDVGLVDELGNRKFNPPSLRGLSHRGPYLHDNRAATLEEIFTKHRHPEGEAFSPADARDLANFLRGL